ncbi:MAG TPA: nucleoside triphosphate pyrophosphohydrolase [Ignavibacteriaceae bacterium]|nr:nucleoside triphosphate pyrophosphohydrolase [Ignavibacteriaceae bacterium]
MNENRFSDLVNIIRRLRVECPWDREQTNDSIKAATIEEAYEVVESIDNKDFDELKIELGDLLLHVIFHSVIAEEENKFKLEDVIDSIQSKLIRRHPHVFGNVEAMSAEDVKRNWETIKLSEGRNSVLEGVPENLPALQRAYRIQEKASKVGFDWDKKEQVWEKVIEEIGEMHKSEKEETREELENEVGDVFFAMVNYSRFLGINPEYALRNSIKKFVRRFNYIEDKVTESGRKIHESNLKEMDKYWNESKKRFK